MALQKLLKPFPMHNFYWFYNHYSGAIKVTTAFNAIKEIKWIPIK